MRGDFSRDTFDPTRHFSRVLMQQGRVLLDADWNEQAAIQLHYLRKFASSLIGPCGCPRIGSHFEISPLRQYLFGIDVLFASELNDKKLSPDLRNVFQEKGRSLTETAMVKVVKQNSEWQIADSTSYHIRNECETVNVYLEDSILFNFAIGAGIYLVDGILCENLQKVAYCPPETITGSWYQGQPNYPTPRKLASNTNYSVYLEVWERHTSFAEYETRDKVSFREVALGDVDTTTRTQIVWQVKIEPCRGENMPHTAEEVIKLVEPWRMTSEPGRLRAKARSNQRARGEQPCITSPEAKYRGSENQLYRVEVHRGGYGWNGLGLPPIDVASFKWSRENGSTVFPILAWQGTRAQVQHLGRDERFGLKIGDLVELVDDRIELADTTEMRKVTQANEAGTIVKPGLLFQVTAIDPIDLLVDLKLPDGLGTIKPPTYSADEIESFHPLLRRWDHQIPPLEGKLASSEGALVILERSPKQDGAAADPDDNWLNLEDGIQIQFQPTGHYQTGDYWLIPARTATGDVDWPGRADEPESLPPHGIERHYALLAGIKVDEKGIVASVSGERYLFNTAAQHERVLET